jgi:hypothetical protein
MLFFLFVISMVLLYFLVKKAIAGEIDATFGVFFVVLILIVLIGASCYFSELESGLNRHKVNIPDEYSMKSLLSVFGIFWALVSLSTFCKGVWRGLGITSVMFVIALVAVPHYLVGKPFDSSGMSRWDTNPISPGFELVYLDTSGKNPVSVMEVMNCDDATRITNDADLLVFYNGREYNIEEDPLYGMNVKEWNSKYVPHWLFHPASFIWGPGIWCLPFFLAVMAITSKLRS